MSLAIRTPLGTVIHTGDWKLDPGAGIGPADRRGAFPRARRRGRAGADLRFHQCAARGRFALRAGGRRRPARASSRSAAGRVAVTTFSSNVGRIRSIAEAARDAGREVLVLGRSMKRVIDVAGELGYMDGLPSSSPRRITASSRATSWSSCCTGSQGEPRAALAKLAARRDEDGGASPGDTVIFSSRTIPGNEKAILEIKNRLIDQGIKIIEDGDALVHVSGHPRRNELRKMYEWTRPQIGVPVHGEAAHLVAQGSLMAHVRHRRGGAGARRRHAAARARARPRSSTRCRSAASTRTAG